MEIIGIGYIRVSSARQTLGVSLDTQEEFVINTLKQHGCTTWRIYRDEGITGRDIVDRDAFIDALKDAAECKANFFATYETSRFARNAEQSLHYFGQIVKQGTIFLSATSKFDDTPESKLMYGMLANFDEYFSNKLSQKIKDNLATLKKKGLRIGPAPGGFLNIRENHKAWLIPHPEYGDVLKRGLKLFNTNKFFKQVQLLEYLIEQGFLTPRKKLPSKQYVSNLIRNPFYCGYNLYENGKLSAPHPYETFITVEEFIENQKKCDPILSNVPHKRVREDLPLKQFAICEKCGKKMVGYSHSNGEGWTFCRYACKTKGCVQSILANDMHVLFRGELERLELDKGKINVLSKLFIEESDFNVRNLIATKESRLKKKKNLESELSQSLITIEKLSEPSIILRFEKKIVGIESELKKLSKSIEEDKYAEPEDYERLFEQCKEKLENPLQTWSDAELNNKVLYQKWLFPQGIFYTENKTLRTSEKCLTYSVSDLSNPLSRNKYARHDSNV